MPITVARRALPGLLLAAAIAPPSRLHAQAAGEVTLFRVVGPRDEVTIGLTAADLDRLGSGAGVERIARALVAHGQVTAWHYVVTRAPDGGTRLATTRRVAILRNDALRIEAYAPALPVSAPPGP